MKLNMYSVFDTATAAYMRPFFMQADGQALRSFMDIASDADHDVGRHPEDYSLCRIGSFNDRNGQVQADKVEVLMTGLEAVAASRKAGNGQQAMFKEASSG